MDSPASPGAPYGREREKRGRGSEGQGQEGRGVGKEERKGGADR